MENCYEVIAEGKRAGYCSVCKQVKNIAKFEQRVSRVGTTERGYAGAVRLAIEHTVCSDCRPKKKPLTKRTRKELYSMAAVGDIRRYKAEDIVRQQQADLKDKQKRAGRKTAFNMHHKKPWAELSAALAKEQQAVRMQVYNLKKGGQDTTKPALYAFATRYLAALSAQRQIHAVDRQRFAPPPAPTWQDAIGEDVFKELKHLYEQVPEKDKAYPTRVPAFYDRTAREGNSP